MTRWGPAYSHARFHAALLALGAPPLGLMGRALEAGDAGSAPREATGGST
jgi:hypothetical protein